MTKEYVGICRGGPLDGEHRAEKSSSFKVLVPVGNFIPFGAEIYEYKHVAGQWILQKEKQDG